MLFTKNDSQIYIREFKKRFQNYCEKAPILLSYTTTPKGVQVIDESTNYVYDFEWDFSIPVKSFIHGIKNILIQQCYPIIHSIESSEIDISKDEQVEMAIEGIPLSDIPVKRYKKTTVEWLLDKVIVFKDIFIIKNLTTGRMYRYKFNKSSVFFLKKIRSGKLDRDQAGAYFFENSELINEIIAKDED